MVEMSVAPPERVRVSRASMWQPRQPVFWLLVGMLAVSLLALIPLFIMAPAGGGVWAVALVGAALQAALLIGIARTIPRARIQPRSLRLGALFAGGFAATGFAATINSLNGDPLQALGLGNLSAALSAPIVEDATRIVCTIAILAFASARRLTVIDGVIYGFLVGAGFEIIENLIYAVRAEDLSVGVQSLITRLLMGFGLHAFWTAIAGGVLAYIWSRRQAGLSSRWYLMIPGYLLPMLLHAGWDAPASSVVPGVKYVEYFLLYAVSLGAFIAVAAWGRRDEWRRYGANGAADGVPGSDGAPGLTRAEWKRLGWRERRDLAAAM